MPPSLPGGIEWPPPRRRQLKEGGEEQPAVVATKSSKSVNSAMKKKGASRFNDTICGKIATSKIFENTTMLVIVLNALWIGIDTEWNHANLEKDGKLPLEPWSIIVENAFCAYFTVELLIRFQAFRDKTKCYMDAWFVFDSILVTCMIIETWLLPLITVIIGGGGGGSALAALSPFRLLRLLRLTRMARLMRFVPEMMTLVKGIVAAARSVGFIFIFLVLVVYVFAILFTSQLENRQEYPLTPYCSDEGENKSDGCLLDTEFGEFAQDKFATLAHSMMTLFTQGVLGDNLAEVVQAILDQSVWLMWAFWVFFIITFATLLNMLIGVLCEVVSQSAEDEAEADSVNSLKGTLEDAFEEIDENDDGVVTELEWETLISHKTVRKSLANVFKDDDEDEHRMDQRLDQRLQQLQATLFNTHSEEDDEDEAMSVDPVRDPSQASTRKSRKSEPEVALTLEQFIKKVVEMRPKQAAGALDLQLLSTQVENDQDFFKSRLYGIEAGLRKIIGPKAAARCPHKSLVKGFSKELDEAGVRPLQS